MSAVPEKIRGGGELFKFRWTAFSRVQQFPFKFYWKHSRVFRYFFYSSLIFFPLMVKGTRATNSPDNVKKWEEIRAGKHLVRNSPLKTTKNILKESEEDLLKLIYTMFELPH